MISSLPKLGFSSNDTVFPLSTVKQQIGFLEAARQSNRIDERTYKVSLAKLNAIQIPCQRSYSLIAALVEPLRRTFGVESSDSQNILESAQRQALDPSFKNMLKLRRQLSKAKVCELPPKVQSKVLAENSSTWIECFPGTQRTSCGTFVQRTTDEKLGASALVMAQAPISQSRFHPKERDAFFAEDVHNELGGQINACLRALALKSSEREVKLALIAAFDFSWGSKLRRAVPKSDSAAKAAKLAAACHAMAVVTFNEHIHVAHLGRCRAYLWREDLKDEQLVQLTVDHHEHEPTERLFMGESRLRRRRKDLDRSSRLLLDVQTEAYWRPQVTTVPLARAAGGEIILMPPTLAENIGLQELRNILSKTSGSGSDLQLGEDIIAHALACREDREMAILIHRVPKLLPKEDIHAMADSELYYSFP